MSRLGIYIERYSKIVPRCPVKMNSVIVKIYLFLFPISPEAHMQPISEGTNFEIGPHNHLGTIFACTLINSIRRNNLKRGEGGRNA